MYNKIDNDTSQMCNTRAQRMSGEKIVLCNVNTLSVFVGIQP